MNQVIQEGIARYQQGRKEHDIDLVQEVRDSMMSSGLGLKIPEAFNNSRFIIEAEGKAADVQRFLLNRYWNQQLMASAKQSMDERYCLIPDGTVEDWLKLFKQKVLPFVIENNLPIVI